jgi:hypothetical protein
MVVSGQFYSPAALLPGKSPWCPLDRGLGGPQSRSGRGGEGKNSQPLPELEPPIIQPIAQRYGKKLGWGTCSFLYSDYGLYYFSI